MHLLYLGGALGGATVGLYQNGGCNESLTRYPLSLKMASFLRESTPYTIVSSAQQCAGLFYYRKGDETDDEQEAVPPDVAKVDFILTLLDKIIGENGHLQPEDRSLIGQSLKRIYDLLQGDVRLVLNQRVNPIEVFRTQYRFPSAEIGSGFN